MSLVVVEQQQGDQRSKIRIRAARHLACQIACPCETVEWYSASQGASRRGLPVLTKLPFFHGTQGTCGVTMMLLASPQQAVDEWFTGLCGFSTSPAVRKLAEQRGQKLSQKASTLFSKRRHLPLRVQALATERGWPLSRAVEVYESVMRRHSLALAEVRRCAP